MTSTLLLARRHVTFSMSPESDVYREPGSCPRFPRAILATLLARGGSEYVDKVVFQVGTDFHEVSECRVT